MEHELRVPFSLSQSPLAPERFAIAHRDRTMRSISRASASASAVLAGGALIGFAFEIRSLTSVFPEYATTKPNTALMVLALAVAINGLASPAFVGARRLRTRAASAFALLLACATIAQYAFEWNLGIDELLFRDPWTSAPQSVPGRPSLAASCALGMLSVAVLLTGRAYAYTAAQACALAAASVGALALIGYAFGARALYAFQSYSSLGPGTALCLILLAVGALAAVPDRGLAGLAAATSVGGAITRRLVPVALGVPFALASLAQIAAQRGIVSPQLAMALFVVTSTSVIGAVVLHTASSIHRLDGIRSRSEALLRESTGRVRHLSALVDGSRLAIVSFDALGRVVTWNPRAERVFGRRASDALGRRPSEVFAADPARAVAQGLEQVLRRGAVQRIALRLETRDGESIQGTLHLAPLSDWERRTVGASAVLEEESGAAALTVAHEAARRLLSRDDLPPEARADAEAVLRAGEPS